MFVPKCQCLTLCFILPLLQIIGCSQPDKAPISSKLDGILKRRAAAEQLEGFEAMAILLPLYADTSYEATRSYSHVGIPRDPEVVSVNDWAAEEIRLNLDAEEYIQAVLQSGNNAMRRGDLSLVNESELIPAIQILPTLFHTRRLEPSLQAIVKTYLENATNNDDASLVVAATIKSLLRVSRDKKSLAEMCSTLVIAEAQDKPKATNTSATLAAIEVIAELAVDSERIRQSLVIAESKYSGSNSRASILKARKAIRNGKK